MTKLTTVRGGEDYTGPLYERDRAELAESTLASVREALNSIGSFEPGEVTDPYKAFFDNAVAVCRAALSQPQDTPSHGFCEVSE